MLDYPAPHRCWERSEHGYCSHPWTYEDVAFALHGGAWFARGTHQFASVAAYKLAILGEHREKTK